MCVCVCVCVCICKIGLYFVESDLYIYVLRYGDELAVMNKRLTDLISIVAGHHS